MEQLILKVLTFDLFVPTTTTFVSLYVTMNDLEERTKFLATVCRCSEKKMRCCLREMLLESMIIVDIVLPIK